MYQTTFQSVPESACSFNSKAGETILNIKDMLTAANLFYKRSFVTGKSSDRFFLDTVEEVFWKMKYAISSILNVSRSPAKPNGCFSHAYAECLMYQKK